MVLGPDPAGELAQEHFLAFLENFQLSHQGADTSSQVDRPINPYVEQLKDMRSSDKTTLNVDFEHVMTYDHLLATDVIRNDYYRFEPFLRKAVRAFVRHHMPAYVEEEVGEKEFWVSFRNLPDTSFLRDLKTEKIGKLVSVSGTVMRTSEVRPELLLGKFSCLICGSEVKDVEQQFKFTQPTICPNAACGNRDKWTLVMHDCKFVDWQRLRIQENSDEVPAGSLPRSLDIVLRNDIVELARAGDKLVFTGTLIAVPDTAALSTPGERTEARNASSRSSRSANASGDGVTGLKALGVRDLNYRLVFLASAVQPAGHRAGLANIRLDNEDEVDNVSLSPEEMDEVWQVKEHPRLYEQLLSSIAPAVYGHIEIKKAVLLMLLGGVHKDTPEGGSLRGDINVLIVGDPSCAKSQFLKYVAGFLPRTVYTSGKSSSAAGLTATVAKEPETGEFCIEAGALMLADNGICCIDEFDKMDITDQVAIHEAMEQQTISIAKAGIQATLNARTSILAAANPSGGRYDRSKSLKYNLALPPAIMSRFDLIYVMIDEPDEVSDFNIAKHIVGVHQHGDDAIEPEFSKEQLQRYIRYARSIKPKFSEGAQQAIIDNYVKLRSRDATPGQKTAYRITVRQLEAMVRLSEALARLRCETLVRPQHVMEASRLLQTSIISVDSHDIELDDEEIPEKYRLLDAELDEKKAEQESAPEVQQMEEGTAEEPSQKHKAPTVSYEKFQKVRDMLIHKLQETERGDQDQEGDHLAGMKQRDLVRWYIDEVSQKVAMGSKELADEYVLTQRIIQHLVKKEGTLIVISSAEDEAEGMEIATDSQERAMQLLDARVLAVNPNFSIE